VLAVSQNPESAASIKKMLQQAGETAFAATSTKQAWDEIRIGRVGLVILDLTAPKADGVLLLSAARSAKSTCTIPFLFLNSSDYKPLNLVIENDEQVRDGWLEMPCDIQGLSTAVTRLFQQKDYSRRMRSSSSSANLKATATQADNSALHPSVLGGQLGPLDVPSVLGMLAPMALTGVLTIKGKKRKGLIHLVNGAVWHASVGEIHGPDALSILFRIAEGRFSFDPAPPPPVRSIQSNTMGILLDGLREKDETQQLLDKLRATERT
jgi:CheY-like chemotaxis protein